MTVPSVSKLAPGGGFSINCGPFKKPPYLVLMYFPSFVRSLSEVAFSEPARSMSDYEKKKPVSATE